MNVGKLQICYRKGKTLKLESSYSLGNTTIHRRKKYFKISVYLNLDILHGGVVIHILNKVFYSVCVLEITCNGFRRRKKAKTPWYLLKGMNTSICEAA